MLTFSVDATAALATVHQGLPILCNKAAKELIHGGASNLHWIWLYPANFAANAISFSLSPIVAAIEAVAAGIFLVAAPFNRNALENSFGFGLEAFLALTFSPVSNIINAVVPTVFDFQDGIATNRTRGHFY